MAANDDWSGEVTDEDWRMFVAHGLRNELADEREDIYTFDDGEPVEADEPNGS